MSREVRRVPLDWQHPTKPNPYWQEQQARREWRGDPEPRLHQADERFVGLMDDYAGSLASWEQEGADLHARVGHHWTFQVEYHLTGFQGHGDSSPVVHPFYMWADDDSEEPVVVRDEDHLHELLLAQHADERPNPEWYMPVFDQPADELGWCLYETVSEGTPVTPVFATADELVEHLATVGQDWDQQPMRRAAAETLVRQGGSFGSFVVAGGVLYDGAKDADVLAEGLSS